MKTFFGKTFILSNIFKLYQVCDLCFKSLEQLRARHKKPIRVGNVRMRIQDVNFPLQNILSK